MKDIIARLIATALVFNSIPPSVAFAAARTLHSAAAPRTMKLAGAPAAGLSALSLPPRAVPSLPASASLPATVKTAAPVAALPSLKEAARTAPTAADAKAAPAALKAQAARAFDAAAAKPGAPAAVETAGLQTAPAPALSAPTAAAVSKARDVPALRGATPSTRRWLPQALLIAGAAIAGWTAQALGYPELMAALPFFMGGMMRGPTSPDGSFLSKMLKLGGPGYMVSADNIEAIGKELGLDGKRSFETVERLARQGRVASMSNGDALLIDFSTEPEIPALRGALQVARQALPLLNAQSPTKELLKAAALLGKAYRDYAGIVSGLAVHKQVDSLKNQRRQIQILLFNVELEALRAMVLELDDKNDAASTQPEVYKRKRDAAAALYTYLNGSYMDFGNSQPERATPEESKLLLQMVAEYDLNYYKGDSAFEQIKQGLYFAQEFARAYLGTKNEQAALLGDRVYDRVTTDLRLGATITPAYRNDLSVDLSVSRQLVDEALSLLASDGRVAALNEEVFVTTLAAERAKNVSGSALEKANAVALMGVKMLNRRGLEASAFAVYALNKALQNYRIAGQPDEAHPDIHQLYQNAMNALLIELMRAYLKSVNPQSRNAENLIAWLGNQHFAVDVPPTAMPSEALQWMLQVLNSIGEKDLELDKRKNSREILLGFQLAKKFLANPAHHLKTLALDDNAATRQPDALPGPSGIPFRVLERTEQYKNLHTYGENITAQAAEGQLKPLIGRKKELRQMIKTLLRTEKNNPIAIGEPGVGKTVLIEGLAQMIVAGEVPPDLRNKNIFKLNIKSMIAGTKYRGEFEERVQGVLREVANSNGRVLLFIDEIHGILGAGAAEGSVDLSQMLLESLGRNGLSIIGATTLDKYRKIEKDGALNRRFNGIMVEPPTPEEAIEIMHGLRSRYEKKHGVTIPDETLKKAVAYATRYVTDRHLPDSALDLLDDASVEVKLQMSETPAGQTPRTTVMPDDIANEIALRMKIPATNITADDHAKLVALPDRLKSRVVGQDEGVNALVRAVRKSRMNYKDPKQPDAFMFLGPTGVGKTELAKALAEAEYGSESAMTVIDMSEFMEKFSVSRLVGAPPGYVGYDEGGKLTEAVRRRPHQVILLDEIDKAHPDVFNILLQAIEEGRLTDGQGRTVNFKNTTIIMTANFLGAHSKSTGGQSIDNPARRMIGIRASRGQQADVKIEQDDMRELYLNDLKSKVRPELLNRIGMRRIIVFNELSRDHLRQIVDIKMKALNKRLADKGTVVRLTDAAAEYLADDASQPHNKMYGGRPIKQAIDEELLDAVSDAELMGQIASGDRVLADHDSTGWVIKKDPGN